MLEGIERIVPGITDPKYVTEHEERYRFALTYIKGVVLDAAFGSGYGSKILSSKAKKVIGLDYSEKAKNYADKIYSGDNIEFRVFNLDTDILPDFDTVVSFETIEHIKDPGHFLKQIFEKAKVFVFSLPLHSPVTDVHLRRFDSIDEVMVLFEAVGFKREDFKFWSQKEAEGDYSINTPPREGAYHLIGVWKK